MRITVVGAGSWGTAMAAHLHRLGHRVTLWAREREVAEGINLSGRNPYFLSDVPLPSGLRAEGDMECALAGCELAVMAVPSRWTREVAREMGRFLPADTPVLNLAKGFDYHTGSRLSVAISEELGRTAGRGVAVLSGPNHAEEVARLVPSATVVASREGDLARFLQRVFSSEYFRVYTNPDVIGVEVGGAYKNVIAIAAGVLDGLGLGDNTKASLITRGLAEMARFGAALGANPITFSGLSGIGDLIVTCISRHSRNRAFGESLGRGERAEEVLSGTRMVVEGVYTTRMVTEMAGGLGVETPIAMGVKAVIEGRSEPSEVLHELMTRRLKEETEEKLYRDFLLRGEDE
ncbi:NAD(P)H-dependent glycerol-3-phosphate dehydrogenase [Candidatus Solincola sp.]|nr:NAD(P)H-dependent glycerol-3-phosphate dehydrogenase [Actinomycetota bacterium]MDI7252581.1 NAD(P)H-dependent glycerol-3-phosphate dehydrogenase [Actinomycetota bacterium]